MKKYIIAALFLISGSVYGQANPDSVLEFFSTIPVYLIGKFIRTENIGGKEYEIWLKNPITGHFFPSLNTSSGTGFLVRYRNYDYLVTAEHVARKLQVESEMVLGGEASKPVHVKISDLVKDTTYKWIFSDSADVAVLPIHPESLLYGDSIKPMPIEMFYQPLKAPLRSKQVMMMGFPLRLGTEKRISAIGMSAYPASGILDFRRADNDSLASFFILDAPSVPGISGGPVYTIPPLIRGPRSYSPFPDSIACVGLVHGIIYDETGGKFAAIVPSFYIVETIKKAKRFEGIVKIFHSNGRLWAERMYKDGMLVEVLSNYDKTGIPVDRGTLRNGTGTVKNYDENGKLLQIVMYKDGVPIDAKTP